MEKKLFQSKHGYLNITFNILGIILFSWAIYFFNTLNLRPSDLLFTYVFSGLAVIFLLGCIRELFLLEKVIF